jgi:hypothetical protein
MVEVYAMCEGSDLGRLKMSESEGTSAGHLGYSHCRGQTERQLEVNTIGNVGGTKSARQIFDRMEQPDFW